MKPTLTFTQFTVNEENNGYSITLSGTINRKPISMVTRPVSIIGIDDEIKKGVLYRALSGFALQAATALNNGGVSFDYPAGMTLAEQLSLFDVKQTPVFSNSLTSAGIESNVVILAIW